MARKNGRFVAKAGKRHGKRVGARSHNKGGHASGHKGGRRHGKRIGHRAASFGRMEKWSALGLPLGVGAVTAVTQLGTGYLVNLAVDKLPWDAVKTQGGKYVARAAISVGGAFAVKKFAPAGMRMPILIGLAGGLVLDTLVTWVLPHLPIPGLHGYESAEQTLQSIEAIAPGTLQGLLAVDYGRGAPMGAMPLDINA